MLEKNLISSIQKYKEEAFALNYYLVENPEVSGKEYNSCKKIMEIFSRLPRKMLVCFRFSRLWFRLLISDSCCPLARGFGLVAIVLSFEKKGL